MFVTLSRSPCVTSSTKTIQQPRSTATAAGYGGPRRPAREHRGRWWSGVAEAPHRAWWGPSPPAAISSAGSSPASAGEPTGSPFDALSSIQLLAVETGETVPFLSLVGTASETTACVFLTHCADLGRAGVAPLPESALPSP